MSEVGAPVLPCWYCNGRDGDGEEYDPAVHRGWSCQACAERALLRKQATTATSSCDTMERLIRDERRTLDDIRRLNKTEVAALIKERDALKAERDEARAALGVKQKALEIMSNRVDEIQKGDALLDGLALEIRLRTARGALKAMLEAFVSGPHLPTVSSMAGFQFEAYEKARKALVDLESEEKLTAEGSEILSKRDAALSLPIPPGADLLQAARRTEAGAPVNMSDEQIKYMVQRFLAWRLPENFSPDAGISFKATFNEHLPVPMRHNPLGTNLLDATQAEAMVRHMLDGLPGIASAAPGAELLQAARAYFGMSDFKDLVCDGTGSAGPEEFEAGLAAYRKEQGK